MKKILVIGVLMALLILDWAALDDITTGNEPNYYGEYGMLLVSLIVFCGLGIILLRKKHLK